MRELLVALSKGNPNQDVSLPVSSRAKIFYGLALACLVIIIPGSGAGQTRTYPKEIRGYKVERTVVEVKKPEKRSGNSGAGKSQTGNGNNSDGQASREPNSESNVDALLQLGKPQLERVTPLGITFKVPIVVSPVKQSGHVDFLVFEDMVVNGTSVDIDEYHHPFDLPNKQVLTLGEPVQIYIYLPNALLAALGDWNVSKETWPVTGRVYVFGKFKKFGFSFKRVVPVELNLSMRNPMKEP
jgi:hypothetical protein